MDTPSRRTPLRRSTHPMVGGVCAGLAAWSGIDPRLVRLAVVVAALLSGGVVVAGYLVAWVLIPPGAAEPAPAEAEPPAAPTPPAATEPSAEQAAAAPGQAAAEPLSGQEYGYAVGDKMQTLVGGPRHASERAVPGAPPRSPSPFVAMDRVATGAGELLRSPETRQTVRRVADQVSRAVSDGADEIARRTRRGG